MGAVQSSDSKMTWRLLFFATVRDAAGGRGEVEIPCPGTADEDDVWSVLLAHFPAIAPLRASCRLARNGRHVEPEEFFQPGDEIAVLPPVSGG